MLLNQTVLTVLASFHREGFQVALVVKKLPASAGDTRDTRSIPGSGRSPGGVHGNPLQYSCLENPTDRGDWQAMAIGSQRVTDTTEVTQQAHIGRTENLLTVIMVRQLDIPSRRKPMPSLQPLSVNHAYLITPLLTAARRAIPVWTLEVFHRQWLRW